MDFKPRQPAKVWPLVTAWCLLVVYVELISPSNALKRCEWPAITPKSTRVALVADPQLIDDHTYPGRPAILEWLTEMITDRYLAKNWRYIQRNLDPDATVFLGDLFDGGRQWPLDQWVQEYDRFNTIYPKPENKRTIMNLPGNHDIGFGNTIVPAALDRFKAWFGPTSQALDLGGHNVVLLDTISMSNTLDENIYGPPYQFMNTLHEQIEPGPIYLCTHVPLWRPKNSGCGRHRESQRDLPYAAGEQYLTQITPELTQEILEKLQPVAIFSGDDHDACHVVHNYTANGQEKFAHEFTVKSASMAMGIASPGIQLLTLNPEGPSSAAGFETSICLLGHPFKPFIWYAVGGIATLLYVFHVNRRHIAALLPLAEVKGKRARHGQFPWKKVGIELGSCALAWLISFWYVGRFMYGI